MKTWLQQHAGAARFAIKRLVKTPIGTFLSALVIGIALALPAGGHVTLQSFLGLSRNIAATPEISIFMRLDAGKDDIEAVRAQLAQQADIEKMEYVSRDDAFRRLHAAEGLGPVLDALPRNPFPDSFVVTPRGQDPAVFARMQQDFAALPKVEYVQLDSAWVARLHALLTFGEWMVLLLAGFLGGALVVVTFNTIRLQIVTNRAEIDVARLLGATDSFIRRPLYWFGALQGVLGGALAWVIVAGAQAALNPAARAMAGAWGLDFALKGLSIPMGFGLMAFAGVLGLVGTAASVRQYLGRI